MEGCSSEGPQAELECSRKGLQPEDSQDSSSLSSYLVEQAAVSSSLKVTSMNRMHVSIFLKGRAKIKAPFLGRLLVQDMHGVGGKKQIS